LFPDLYLDDNKKTLLVAVSRSGETSETVHAMQLFKNGNFGKIMSITTVPNSSVTRLADLNLIAETAQEVSIAQTRSFASMMLLAAAFALQVGGEDAIEVLSGFPSKVDYLLTQYHDLAEKLGQESSFERFFFLGPAYNYGIACEAMLKMKEMSLSNSEAFHTLEFRHGPKSMVDEKSLVIGLVNESTASQEIPVLEEMAALKGKILSIAEKSNARLEAIGDVVELNSGVSEPLRALLFLPVLQLLAFHRAISRGQDPDNPHNLDAVVHIPSMAI
jgi:glutamine---fructose-6-phosphate transaminase (isomerizing)